MEYLIFSENVSRSHRFLDSAVFVRNKVFGSESSAIADVYYSLMCDQTECEYGALVEGECCSSARYLSTENLPIRECSRSIERHITETLQASFANCGLNTEAELLLYDYTYLLKTHFFLFFFFCLILLVMIFH